MPDAQQKTLKLQDKVVGYVKDIAEYAGLQIEFENSDFDGDVLYLSFSPADLLTTGDYEGDDLAKDVRVHALKNKYHVMVDLDEDDDNFRLEISGLKDMA